MTLRSTYEDKVWPVLPLKWRYWWVHNFDGLILTKPDAVTKVVTPDIFVFTNLIDSGKLGNLASVSNKYLMQTVSCLW